MRRRTLGWMLYLAPLFPFFSCAKVNAHAQQVSGTADPDQSRSKNEAKGGEIIVTALRRSASLQSTPLSMTALSGDILRNYAASGIQDYFRQVPNLNFTEGAVGQARLSIRGVQSAGEATVGVYYDETPVTGPAGTSQDAGNDFANLNLFDTKRVEVLRGPQGTLYGSSSMAGTLRIIFNKPDTQRFSVAGESELSGVDGGQAGWSTKYMVNLPVKSNLLAVRLVGYYQHEPGFIDNVLYNRKNVNGSNDRGVRAMVALTPSDDLKITGTLIYERQTTTDQTGYFQKIGNYKTNLRARLPFNSKMRLFNVIADWDLHFAALTATASQYDYDILRTIDFTGAVLALSSVPSGCQAFYDLPAACAPSQLSAYHATGVSDTPAIAYQPATLNSQNYEIRLSTQGGGPFQAIVGGYYEKRRDHIDAYVSQGDPATGRVYLPLQNLSYRYVATDTRQTAFFGEASYSPLKSLMLTAGVRHYDYTKTTSGQVLLGSPLAGTVVGPFSQARADAKGWLYKFNVSYHFSPDVMGYLTSSKGFRPGGANNIPGLPTGLVAYQPDSLWNYELGLKSSFLDRKLIVNVSVFQIDWSNIQVMGTSASNLFAFTSNAGAARIRGAEAEVTARPIQGLTLTGSIGYTDAKLTKDEATSAFALSGSTGLAGDRLPGTPEYSASATASYSWPLTDSLSGLIWLDYAYTGKITAAFRRDTDPYYEVYGKYSTVDGRVGVERKEWGAYLFARNLTNTKAIVSASSSLGVERLLYSLPPRTVGISVRFQYRG